MRRVSLLLIAAAAFAANQMDGPSLGWMWDKDSKSLRRLGGLPGSLRNEDAPDLGSGVQNLWLAPGQDQAVLAREGGQLEKRNLLTGTAVTLESEAPDRVVFSADGTQVGLWWKAAGRFALWGEIPVDLDAKSILLRNDGEALVVDAEGTLRTLKGAWLGNFGAEAAIAMDEARLFVAGHGALTIFDRSASGWELRSRREDAQVDTWRQIEIETDGLLVVTAAGELQRCTFDGMPSETLARSGVSHLSRLRQAGFYLAEGETLQLLFARSASQKLYLLPATEVRQ